MARRSGPVHPANIALLLPAALCALIFRSIDFLWLEAILLTTILIAAAIFSKRLSWTARPPAWCRGLRKLSHNAALACLLPALLSVALRLSLLPWIPIPNPVVPDEFSHILLAKTLLLGRLANPAHPLWQHFESIHILSQPTYSSMYMAGQACFLAIGQLAFGNLFWGVVLSTALCCAAMTWFLRAWAPPGWALFGGLLFAVRIGAASYWNDSYWGGSAGALGAAMLLGAYPRLLKAWKPASAIVFAIGLVVLANTRPYEGAALGSAIVVLLIYNLWKRSAVAIPAKRIAVSATVALIVLGASGWAMTQHWKAVTGHALTLPYQVNQQTYGWPLTLPWTKVLPIEFRHPELALYRAFELGEHRQITVPSDIPIGLLLKYASAMRFFFGLTLCATFLFTTRILKACRTRAVWLSGAVVALAVITEQSGYPHYWAPAAPAMLLFIVQGLRHLAQCGKSGTPWGPAIVRAAMPLSILLLTARVITLSAGGPPPAIPNFVSWCCVDTGPRDRAPIVEKLQTLPGRHLVIVTYDFPKYDTVEWVYNEPDIDSAKIVYARDMGKEENQKLIDYYADRRVWQLRIGQDHNAILQPLNDR